LLSFANSSLSVQKRERKNISEEFRLPAVAKEDDDYFLEIMGSLSFFLSGSDRENLFMRRWRCYFAITPHEMSNAERRQPRKWKYAIRARLLVFLHFLCVFPI